MRDSKLIRAALAAVLCFALPANAWAASRQLARDGEKAAASDINSDRNEGKSDGERRHGDSPSTDEERLKQTVDRPQLLPKGATIIVGERPLVGAFAQPQQRGGRLFLPVVAIARALGDQVNYNPSQRTIEVQRQTGVTADFSAQTNQVRENSAVVLVVSDTGDLVFPINPEALMLPVEIVAPLLDVAILIDQASGVVRITRGAVTSGGVRPGARHAPWELHGVDYAYNFNSYSSSFSHNFLLNSHGRIGDGRFSLTSNLDGGTGQRSLGLRNGTFRFDRSNGQRLMAGDFGTGIDLQFLSSAVRGIWAQQPFGGFRFTSFAGRAESSSLLNEPIEIDPITRLPLPSFQRQRTRFDTNVIGSYATFGPSVSNPDRPATLLYSAGAMHFGGPNNDGDLLTGSMRYASERHQFQSDLGIGSFSGRTFEGASVDGGAALFDVSDIFKLTETFTLQGRFTHVGENFLTPQSTGIFRPMNQLTGGFNWRAFDWLSASFSGQTTRELDQERQRNRALTATVSMTPRGWLPTLLVTHTQTENSLSGGTAYTLVNATRDFNRFRLFGNFTRLRIERPGFEDFNNLPTGLAFTAGGLVRVNDAHTVQATQTIASGGSYGGTVDWLASSFISMRVSFGAGFGYNVSGGQWMTTERLLASVQLPAGQAVQVTYVRTPNGPQLFAQLRGLLFTHRRAQAVASLPLGEIASLSAFQGRVYQDINLNGRYDPGVDKPQANVNLRVDGSYFATTDANGEFRIENIKAGQHTIYLDLLSVRADLTLLDGAEQTAYLQAGRDALVDFRLVRTGRVSGRVWIDTNGNGQPDDGEEPLADIRILNAMGRDTLTDSRGEFTLADIPPGEHVLLVDEKTLPENMRSITGSLTITIQAGTATGPIYFPITPKPAIINVKRFP